MSYFYRATRGSSEARPRVEPGPVGGRVRSAPPGLRADTHTRVLYTRHMRSRRGPPCSWIHKTAHAALLALAAMPPVLAERRCRCRRSPCTCCAAARARRSCCRRSPCTCCAAARARTSCLPCPRSYSRSDGAMRLYNQIHDARSGGALADLQPTQRVAGLDSLLLRFCRPRLTLRRVLQ